MIFILREGQNMANCRVSNTFDRRKEGMSKTFDCKQLFMGID